jgi:hypothetical protein
VADLAWTCGLARSLVRPSGTSAFRVCSSDRIALFVGHRVAADHFAGPVECLRNVNLLHLAARDVPAKDVAVPAVGFPTLTERFDDLFQWAHPLIVRLVRAPTQLCLRSYAQCR